MCYCLLLHFLLGEETHACCYFHETQSTMKNLAKLGLKGEYGDNVDFNLHVRALLVVTLIPIEEMMPAFDALRKASLKLFKTDAVKSLFTRYKHVSNQLLGLFNHKSRCAFRTSSLLPREAHLASPTSSATITKPSLKAWRRQRAAVRAYIGRSTGSLSRRQRECCGACILAWNSSWVSPLIDTSMICAFTSL
jgi:hypothetical protein